MIAGGQHTRKTLSGYIGDLSKTVRKQVILIHGRSSEAMTSHNPLHNDRPQIFMLAVLRLSDKTVVATHSSSRDVTKEGVRECVAGNAQITAARRYTSQGDTQSIHYFSDTQGRVYAIVTNRNFLPRVAFLALDELQREFADFGSKVASSVEEGLTKDSKLTLKAIAEKYLSHILLLYRSLNNAFVATAEDMRN